LIKILSGLDRHEIYRFAHCRAMSHGKLHRDILFSVVWSLKLFNTKTIICQDLTLSAFDRAAFCLDETATPSAASLSINTIPLSLANFVGVVVGCNDITGFPVTYMTGPVVKFFRRCS
jgi:hypothetical protein